MTDLTKGKSPFYPGQPVPVELFVGRRPQIERILTRGVGQVAAGKPIAMFVQGEYGIGKSSIANYAQTTAELNNQLYGIYAPLGGARNVEDVALIILKATVGSGLLDPNRAQRIRNWLAKYIGDQTLFGVKVNLHALLDDAPELSNPFGLLNFLSEATTRLEDTQIQGIFLVLDEINGITSDPLFSQYIKGIIDNNATRKTPVPLLLMLCGVEERRRDMILKHQPVDRIFDIIDIEPMTETEMRDFFTQSFAAIDIRVDPDALDIMTEYSAGFPKIMHMIGDAVFWINSDDVISEEDARAGLLSAADDVGKKFFEQQVIKALRSSDYRSILEKIGRLSPAERTFTRAQVAEGLTAAEAGKLGNFLRKMEGLNVIRKGDVKGEYVFMHPLARVYIWLQSFR